MALNNRTYGRRYDYDEAAAPEQPRGRSRIPRATEQRGRSRIPRAAAPEQQRGRSRARSPGSPPVPLDPPPPYSAAQLDPFAPSSRPAPPGQSANLFPAEYRPQPVRVRARSRGAPPGESANLFPAEYRPQPVRVRARSRAPAPTAHDFWAIPPDVLALPFLEVLGRFPALYDAVVAEQGPLCNRGDPFGWWLRDAAGDPRPLPALPVRVRFGPVDWDRGATTNAARRDDERALSPTAVPRESRRRRAESAGGGDRWRRLRSRQRYESQFR
ncbi:hypothetical protein F5B20DRAFT_579128 [Whalleya microplaca]|nr:hypothetical protein F5B20DRAFT_579128 [Whalleya microplaca]